MTDTNENATPAVDTFKKENIEKRYFVMPGQAEEAQDYIAKILSVLPGNEIKYNFDQTKDLPENSDLLILPISKRSGEGKGNEIIGACIAVVPSLDAIRNHPKGEEFVRNAIVTSFSIKLGNAVRPKDDGSTASSIPQTADDFIESRRGGGGLEAFNTVGKDIVAALRKKGLKLMTVPLLRQVLQSKQFAENQYPKIPQDHWVKVLDIAVAAAEKAQLDPGVMKNWKDTRDQATVDDVTSFDLSLDDLAA